MFSVVFFLFKVALYVFYPGEYVLGSLLFLLTLLVLKRDLKMMHMSKEAKQCVTNAARDDSGYDNPVFDRKRAN
jgi:hypothetical protein